MRVLIGMLIGLLIGLWLGSQDLPWAAEENAPAKPLPAPEQAQQTPEKAGAADAGVQIAPAAAAIALAAPSGLGFDATLYAQRWRQRMDALMRQALQNDASALRELAEEWELCQRTMTGAQLARQRQDQAVFQFLDDYQRECMRLYRSDPVLGHWYTETIANQRRAYEAQKNGQSRPADLGPVEFAETLYAQAAAAGDPVARVRARPPDDRCSMPGAGALASDFAQSARCYQNDLIERLRLALGARDPASVARIGRMRTLISSGYHYAYFPMGAAREVLWMMAACELGWDCGPNGPALRWACAYGACGYRHYAQYAADQLLTPAEMRRVSALLPSLLAILQRGDVAALLARP